MSKDDLDRFTDFMVEYKEGVVKDYEEEIERLNEIIEDLHKKLCDIQDFIEYEIKQLDDNKFLLRVLDLEEMLDIIKRS